MGEAKRRREAVRTANVRPAAITWVSADGSVTQIPVNETIAVTCPKRFHEDLGVVVPAGMLHTAGSDEAAREHALGEIREFAKKNDVPESAILWAADEINKRQGNAIPGLSDGGRGVAIIYRDGDGWSLSVQVEDG